MLRRPLARSQRHVLPCLRAARRRGLPDGPRWCCMGAGGGGRDALRSRCSTTSTSNSRVWTCDRLDRIAAQDHTKRFGIPVLAPPLALLLLGASESDRRVHVAVHDLVFQRFTARRHLLDVLKRYGGRGRRGTTKFRAAVRSLDEDGRASQTNLELDLVRLLALHGLPTPQLQLPVLGADGDDPQARPRLR